MPYSRAVNAEFNWWLLIVGLVVGAGLVWLVVADSRRREVDVLDAERGGEARWIAAAMADSGRQVSEADVLEVVLLHGAYLAAMPPDEIDDGDDGHRPGGDDAWTEAPRSDGGRVPNPAARVPMAHPVRVTERPSD